MGQTMKEIEDYCQQMSKNDDARIQEGTEVDQPLLQYVGFLGEQN